MALARALLWLAENELIPSSRIESNGEVTWRKHWLFLLVDVSVPFVLTVASSFLMVLGFFGIPASAVRGIPYYPAIMLVATVLCWGWLSWVFSDWANDQYTVTSDRIIDIEKRPLSTEKRNEARLADVQNIRLVVPGFWANALGYGSVLIQTAGAEDFTFDNVPNPRDVQSVISQKMQAYRDAEEERQAAQRRDEMGEWFSVYEEVRQRQALRENGRAEAANDSVIGTAEA